MVDQQVPRLRDEQRVGSLEPRRIDVRLGYQKGLQPPLAIRIANKRGQAAVADSLGKRPLGLHYTTFLA